jgi:hypothetical protein
MYTYIYTYSVRACFCMVSEYSVCAWCVHTPTVYTHTHTHTHT